MKPSIYIATAVAMLTCFGNEKLAAAQDDNTQTSELDKLQAAYHRAASVHNPVNGDSPEAITIRIRDISC